MNARVLPPSAAFQSNGHSYVFYRVSEPGRPAPAGTRREEIRRGRGA